MIGKILAFTDSQGNTYGTLEAAQKAELKHLLDSEIDADVIIKNKDKIIDILTTTPTSKPRARKINGATRARKPKRHEAEQFPLPMEDTTKPAA